MPVRQILVLTDNLLDTGSKVNQVATYKNIINTSTVVMRYRQKHSQHKRGGSTPMEQTTKNFIETLQDCFDSTATWQSICFSDRQLCSWTPTHTHTHMRRHASSSAPKTLLCTSKVCPHMLHVSISCSFYIQATSVWFDMVVSLTCIQKDQAVDLR